MSVNNAVSDIFFSYDVSSTLDEETGSYCRGEIEVLAGELLNSLQYLGVSDLPSVNDLVDDFFSRL